MEGEDIKSVMKWVGYVYIPVIIIFVAVYCLVQYRLRMIENAHAPTTVEPAPIDKTLGAPALPTMPY